MSGGSRAYEASVQITEAIKRGEDVSERVAQLEGELKGFYKRERFVSDLTYVQDALYEVSASVRRYWQRAYDLLAQPEARYEALLRFVGAREMYLGAPHEESVRLLKTIGWTNADVLAAYLYNRCASSRLRLSPDAVAEAAREDQGTARRLLAGEGYDELFPAYGKGYNACRHEAWIDFCYYFMGYSDRTFLEAPHKSKRLAKYCREVCAKLEQGPASPAPFSPAEKVPDLSIFDQAELRQKQALASAARQKLRRGSEQDGYYVHSFHLVDEAQGFGAALCFEPLCKGIEYSTHTVKAYGVQFYRFRYLLLFDYIPPSWRCQPEAVGEGFVQEAYQKFCKVSGGRQ